MASSHNPPQKVLQFPLVTQSKTATQNAVKAVNPSLNKLAPPQVK